MIGTSNENVILSAFVNGSIEKNQSVIKNKLSKTQSNLLQPLRQWLDSLDIQNQKLAKFIAKLIPAQCPFERDIILFGRKITIFRPCAS